MRALVLISICYLGFGYFFVPPYDYSDVEQRRLLQGPSVADYIVWPMRGYSNWQSCGALSYCREARCAALDGGCAPAAAQSPRGVSLHLDPSLNSDERLKRIEVWCTAVAPEHEDISVRQRNLEVSCSNDQPREQADEYAKPMPGDGVQVDTTILIECDSVAAASLTEFTTGYERYCR